MFAREITQDGEHVRVAYDGGQITAKQVVVAIPPTLAGRITYSPPMPASRDLLTQQMPMGSVIKIQVAYETPFRPEDGLSGSAFTLEGLLSVTMDNTPHDNGSLDGAVESGQRVAAEILAVTS
ncbi:MAG: FAD-dependent oxidoreductase [Actinomycetales bacterium]